MKTLKSTKAITHAKYVLSFIFSTTLNTNMHLHIRTTNYSFLRLGVRLFTFVYPWIIMRTLVGESLLEPLFILNIKSSLRIIFIFDPCPLKLHNNLLKLLLLNFFDINRQIRDVHARKRHSLPTLINHKVGYRHKKFVYLIHRNCHHSRRIF